MRLPSLLLSLTLTCLASVFARAEQPPRKIALLIGVSDYVNPSMEDLSFAEKDALDLGRTLRAMGFDAATLVGKDADQQTVQRRIDQFLEHASTLDSDSVVFIMFSGHGQQLRVSSDSTSADVPFYCPRDAIPFDPAVHSLRGKTAREVEQEFKLISLNRLIGDIDQKSNSLQNLLVVDACRNNPTKGKSAGITGAGARELPRGISILFAARSGQKSWESSEPKVKQGVFTHFLLRGLAGDAANARNEISWSGLTSYVQEEVDTAGWKLAGSPSYRQTPQAIANSDRTIRLNETLNLMPTKNNPTFKWKTPIGESPYTRLTKSGDNLYVSTKNKSRSWDDYQGVMTCLDARRGHEKWKFETKPVSAQIPPHSTGGGYASSTLTANESGIYGWFGEKGMISLD